RPRIVVVENVAAFVGSVHHARLVEALEDLGYETSTQILNAVDFGVAQLRERSFTFASKGALPRVVVRSHDALSVRQALAGLPPVPDGRNNHFAPIPTGIAAERMRFIPEGGDKRDVMRRRPDLVPQ